MDQNKFVLRSRGARTIFRGLRPAQPPETMLYTIGQFSGITGLPAKTLRYYDEVGLLNPAITDESTGYRYYKRHQILTARRIKTYRDCDLSIQEIKTVLQHEKDGNPAALLKALESKESWLAERLKSIQRLQREIRDLRFADEEPFTASVNVIEIPARRVLSMRRPGTYTDVPEHIEALLKFADKSSFTIEGSPLFLWGDEQSTDDPHVEVAVPVLEQPQMSDPYSIRELPGGNMACVRHRGDRSELGHCYERLFDWSYEHECPINGQIREIHVRSGAPGEIETEIQMPIRIIAQGETK